MSLTSYTHEPFYSKFILEIQDNWRWASSYNLPLEELMRVMEEAVKNGWTFAWGAILNVEGIHRNDGSVAHGQRFPGHTDLVCHRGQIQSRRAKEHRQQNAVFDQNIAFSRGAFVIISIGAVFAC